MGPLWVLSESMGITLRLEELMYKAFGPEDHCMYMYIYIYIYKPFGLF